MARRSGSSLSRGIQRIPSTERITAEFRPESFNLADAPNTQACQLQFALKLLFQSAKACFTGMRRRFKESDRPHFRNGLAALVSASITL